MKLLLDLQVTYPQLAALLKEVFMEVAERDFRLDDKAQTDSRLSLLTGIHRKDVKRLRDLGHAVPETPAHLSLGSQIVTRWTSEPDWLAKDGTPRPLPRQATADEPGFDSLVESVSRDIRSRAVLDEWLRLGVAHVDDEDRVTLDALAFIPSKGFDEKAFYIGRNVGDHIAAGAHNLAGAEPPLPERSVYYNHLSPESIDALHRLAEETGMEALQTVNRRAMALQREDSDRPGANRRFNFGIFIYHEAEPEDPTGGEEGDA